MKRVRRIIIGIIVIVVLAICAIVVLPQTLGEDHPITQAIDSGKVAATNAAIDASGIKTKAQEALEANADVIAQRTGLPLKVVDSAIESLDIESWQVAVLPRDAQSTGTFDIDYNGMAAEVTTYTDPSIVTVNMYGQSVTLAVPEKSQPYVRYLTLM